VNLKNLTDLSIEQRLLALALLAEAPNKGSREQALGLPPEVERHFRNFCLHGAGPNQPTLAKRTALYPNEAHRLGSDLRPQSHWRGRQLDHSGAHRTHRS
jgi:hypothetical protein